MSAGFIALLLFIYLAGSAFFSGMETGGYLVNRLRLRWLVRQGSRPARQLRRGLSDAHRFIFTVLIGNNIAIYLLSRDVTNLYLNNGIGAHGDLFGFLPWNAEAAATFTLLIPLFIFGELLPKNWFHRHADSLMYRFSALLLFFEWLFYPLVFLLKRLSILLADKEQEQRVFDRVSLSLRGLQEYFSGELGGGLLSDHQHGMINNLVSLHRVPVRDLMTPVSRVICLSDQASVCEALDLMRNNDCEQVVLYSRGHRKMVGYVSLFDLMDPAIPSGASAFRYMRKMIRLSSNLSANRALKRLRKNPGIPAVVLDRSSQAVGLLHLRDVAAYIVSGA